MQQQYDLPSLVDPFLQRLADRNYSPATIRLYSQTFKRFIASLTSESIHYANEITLDHIYQFQQTLNQAKLSPATIAGCLRQIKCFFDDLEKHQLLFENPTHNLVIKKQPKPLPTILTEQQIKQLLSSPNCAIPKGLRDRAILELLYATAIRRQKCIDLTLSDIDTHRHLIFVTGKGRKQRFLPTGKQAAIYLERYLKYARPALCRTASIPPKSLWINKRRGLPLDAQSMAVMIRNYARKANIPFPVSPHMLRRTCATHMLQHGAHPLMIAELLGHATTSTLNHYLRLSIQDLKHTHQKTKPGI